MGKTRWEEFNEALDALEDMWHQYAYPIMSSGKVVGKYDGGLSALENANDVLMYHNRIDGAGNTKPRLDK